MRELNQYSFLLILLFALSIGLVMSCQKMRTKFGDEFKKRSGQAQMKNCSPPTDIPARRQKTPMAVPAETYKGNP